MESKIIDEQVQLAINATDPTAELDHVMVVMEDLGTNVFVADTDRILIYRNARSKQTLSALESTLQEELGLAVNHLEVGL